MKIKLLGILLFTSFLLSSADARDESSPDERWAGIKQRIEGAVDRGDMTREQANEKYAAIKREMAEKETVRKREGDRERPRGARNPEAEKWARMKQEVEGAVKRGDISRDEANEKFAHIKREMAQGARREADRPDPRKERFMQAEREIRAKVEAGEMHPEAARERLTDLRKSLFGGEGDREHAERDRRPPDDELYETVNRGLRAAVALGKLDEEEAHRMWEEFNRDRNSERQRQRELQEHMERGIRAAVELGKMSEDEAHNMLRNLHQESEREHAGDRQQDERRQDMEDRERRFHAAEREVHQAVRAGKLSEEDAERKLGELRKKVFPRD